MPRDDPTANGALPSLQPETRLGDVRSLLTARGRRTRRRPATTYPLARPTETVVTRYREAFTWTRSIDEFVQHEIRETPLLNVCAGRSSWGDVTLDLHEAADVQGDWQELPFDDDSFGAVFADPPWDSGHKTEVARYMREALRVAPVAYLMAPWLYCAAWAKITRVWYREFPGIHTPILLSRYERSRQLRLTYVDVTPSDRKDNPRGSLG